jgi:hypothetical protein
MITPMPAVKPTIFDDGAHAGHAEQEQYQSRHQCRNLQPVDAMVGGDPGEDDDERAGRPGNLQAAAAQHRNHEARHDRRVQSLFRLGSRGNGKGHRQRQGNHPDDDARHDIGQPVFAAQQAGSAGFKQGDHGVPAN